MNDLTDTELREKILKHTQKGTWIALEEIDVPSSARPHNATDVVALAGSIREIGLQTLLSVVERDGRYVLIAGRHRLEALRLIGVGKAPCRIVDMTEIEARLWTISENLCRTELRQVERSAQVAEYARLIEERGATRSAPAHVETPESTSSQPASEIKHVRVAHVSGGRGHQGGISRVARDLRMSRDDVRRSLKVDGLSPEAKEAAADLGLDNNRRALLEAARQPTSETQVAEIERIAVRKAEPRYDVTSPPNLPAATAIAHPLRNLVNISGGGLAAWIKTTTPNDRSHVIRVLRMAADILADELNGAEAA